MIACIPKVHVTCIPLPIRHLQLGFQLWRCWPSGWRSTLVPSIVHLLLPLLAPYTLFSTCSLDEASVAITFLISILNIPVEPHPPMPISKSQLPPGSQFLCTSPHFLLPFPHCTQLWVTLSLLLLCCSLCHSVHVSLVAPAVYIPKSDSCWLLLKTGQTIPFSPLFPAWKGLYTILLLLHY